MRYADQHRSVLLWVALVELVLTMSPGSTGASSAHSQRGASRSVTHGRAIPSADLSSAYEQAQRTADQASAAYAAAWKAWSTSNPFNGESDRLAVIRDQRAAEARQAQAEADRLQARLLRSQGNRKIRICPICHGKKVVTCPTCRGTGGVAFIGAAPVICTTCGGARVVRCERCEGRGVLGLPGAGTPFQRSVRSTSSYPSVHGYDRLCTACSGRGTIEVTCRRCGGTGRDPGATANDDKYPYTAWCPVCHGNGVVTQTCRVCGGKGRYHIGPP